jgi:hypothetical protein
VPRGDRPTCGRVDEPALVGTWVIAMSRVRGRIARSSAATSSCPEASSSTTSISMPARRFIWRNAR